MTPRIRQVVLDCAEARPLAEFYRHLFDLTYRPSDVEPRPGEDWLVLQNPHTGVNLAFQAIGESYRPPVWDGDPPMQAHLDTTVEDVDALWAADARVRELGGVLRHDRTDDASEPLRVYTDPAGHPFCIFVG